jgi:hypothetical protein
MPQSRTTKFPYVYRAVYPKNYIDGYLAKIVRKECRRRLFAVFQLANYDGDHVRCLKAAANAAAAFDKAHPKIPRWELSKTRRCEKKDKDLPAGLRRLVKTSKGRMYNFIEASWSPEPNVQKKRSFAVSKTQSEKQAIALALAERKAGIVAIRQAAC